MSANRVNIRRDDGVDGLLADWLEDNESDVEFREWIVDFAQSDDERRTFVGHFASETTFEKVQA